MMHAFFSFFSFYVPYSLMGFSTPILITLINILAQNHSRIQTLNPLLGLWIITCKIRGSPTRKNNRRSASTMLSVRVT
ncbi:hypothetical protein V8C43DRAFT_143443 [Trichoderma afarasin]